MEHFSHEHPLVFIQDIPASEEEEAGEEASCFGCEDPVALGPIYRCSKGCKFYLHKRCAELRLGSKIHHPLHPQHPLSFFQKPLNYEIENVFYACDFCGRQCSGFVYHCMSCDFGLDINCALLEHSVIANLPRLEHFSHPHPLLLVKSHKSAGGFCAACGTELSGEIYSCFDCNYDLHKECAELPDQIDHPFHSSHSLELYSQAHRYRMSTGQAVNACHLCRSYFTGFVYRCVSCDFDLDVKCAQLQISEVHKLEHFSHEHPLFFIENDDKTYDSRCNGCRKPVSDGFYRCVDCLDFDLHKECAELPLQINHPYDRKHPLTLLSNPPTHPENCSCLLCEVEYKGFIYYCSLCEFGVNPENVSLPRMITNANHEHPWLLLSTRISFTCNFCGIRGDCAPYVCTTCDLVVHKNCITLPHKIKTTRHRHKISHNYFLDQNNLFEKRECGICFHEVKTDYGSYCCSECNYIAHVKCATDEANWDEAYVLEDGDEAKESMTLITNVIRQSSFGEDVIATEVTHAYHEHNLILTFIGEVEGDNVCDGCMRNISLPFYSCEQCGFFLHRHCAELLRVGQSGIHKHRLLLKKGGDKYCLACYRRHHGFNYKCEIESCFFQIDIQCFLQSDSLSHPSHEHLLLLVRGYQGKCTSCKNNSGYGYRCKERCGFIICLTCITQPPTAWCKYDKHLVTLAYSDGSDESRLFCDLCEEVRDSSTWFYSCEDCDTTVHSNCVLGDLPFVKVGRGYYTANHRHTFKIFKKIWNSPPCDICGKICGGQAIECTVSSCKLVCHVRCIDG